MGSGGTRISETGHDMGIRLEEGARGLGGGDTPQGSGFRVGGLGFIWGVLGFRFRVEV